MRSDPTLDPASRAAKRRAIALSAGLLMLASVATPARAVDGCLVLLCFAAPSWRSIPQCVAPIQQVLKDLARGKAFPSCAMSGAGNSAASRWADAPSDCPPQYTIVSSDGDGGRIYTCLYLGAVSVTVQGSLWSTTWWNMDGSTVTEFSATAKQQLAQWSTQFDDDYAAWAAAQAKASSCSDC